MAGPLVLFVSARLQAIAAALLCLAALQLTLAVGWSAGAPRTQAAPGIRMALRR